MLSKRGIFMTGKFTVTRASLEAQFSSLCRNFDDDLKTFLLSNGFAVFPGFCDVHVHFREPGFSYKETVLSGSHAAAHGGYTAVCTMPNLNPVPDSRAHLDAALTPIRSSGAGVNVLPYGALTVGEAGEVPADLDAMAPDVIAFSDDGRGVQSESMMRSLMERCASLGKILAAHCEDNSLLRGGYIHDGAYAAAHGHRGIPSESEWGPIRRDLRLAKETGCAYHVCHISTKESVALIRAAKAEGVNVTCETAPHYLILDDGDLCEDGRFKMNPPLRSPADREALLEGLCNGTIDMIATDHAPHSAEEKSRGLEKSAFGVVGLETAFPALYTKLVKTGISTLDRLIELLAWNPRVRFGIPLDDAYTVWDLEREGPVDPAAFLSMGRATPFQGMVLAGECVLTSRAGRILYRHE
ncbi:MAG: dihydroorotase [Clostridia bacterium]|nr:dihydroorotase [Clostridia bacterium]MBR5366013.1 dihydroorotase [Clostridia bacterium]